MRGAVFHLPPEQHSLRKHHGASKRKLVPQTTRDTPEGVQKPSTNETELL